MSASVDTSQTGPDVRELLASYPRCRSPLSDAHRAVYVEEYQRNRSAAGFLPRIISWMESWSHRRIAAAGKPGEVVLDLGAGTLNHMRYEKHFSAYDVVEPFQDLLAQSTERELVREEFANLSDCLPDRRYDRIFSEFTLEHLVDLPRLVAQSGQLLAEGGLFQAGIPSEGGFLWGMSWKLTTGISYRLRTGLDYGILMRHEHVNTAPDIEAVLRYFFENVHVTWFPTPLFQCSFHGYIEASGPRADRCGLFLGQ